ncbi:MAG: T9SS type A sorting domain-containing protein [Chryseobacterium sp.]|nr:T9SS type A sorting domain-containing protein [Chryseobacterium sp.]
MKNKIILLFFAVANIANAQAPANYYSTADGLTGYTLKSKLAEIITAGAKDMGYGSGTGGLWLGFKTTDIDKYYENDGTIIDMYSENPAANTPGVSNDPYEFKWGQVSAGGNQCGNYSGEGSCYNREHSLPKTYFGGIDAVPMSHDIHFVVPTDGYTNSKRGDYPYGEVSTATWTSKNGTKVGPSKVPGYSGSVFEPINEFKGDFARMALYFVTRYENQLTSFSQYQTASSPLDGSKNRGLQLWYLNLMLKWSEQDPVSQKEIDRNNAAYTFQGNRNPFIDHPEWITEIWGLSPLAVDDTSFSKNLTIAPNPVKGNTINITGDKDLKQFTKAFIYNMVGQNVQTIENPFKNGNKITIRDLPKGVYILKTGELNTKFIID